MNDEDGKTDDPDSLENTKEAQARQAADDKPKDKTKS
jgi:hypothetical protein